MHLSLARNFAKGIDPGKRAWIPPAEAITVPAEDTHNQLGEACIDMLRGPGTTGGVTTGSKLVIRGIPPTAMGAYPGQDRYEIMASICSKPASKWTPIWLSDR